MNGHPQFDEDFELLALGTIEGEERRALESHVAACPECARKAEEARGRVALLALAVDREQPSARVRESLLRRARGGLPQRSRARFASWMIPTFAAATVALAVITGLLSVENWKLRQMLSEARNETAALHESAALNQKIVDLLMAPDTAKVALVSGSTRPSPVGKAFYHPQKGLLFYAANLPVLPADRTYQLWLVPTAGKPISAGTFAVDARGNGQVLLPTLPAGVTAAAFAVTVEPGGGVAQPTGPKVLVGTAS